MKELLTTLALIFSIQLAAQDTKRVNVSNETPPFKESFYVLKSDRTVKHGEYTRTYHGGRVVRGTFNHNKRVGVWQYLDSDGRPEMRIDFDNTRVFFSKKQFKLVSKFMMADGDSFREVIPEEEPVFFGGSGNIFYYLLGIRYPVDARRNGIQGTVIISATITQDGRIIDEAVKEGAHQVLNDEALRVIRVMADEWFPGKMDGKNVDMRVLIPVTFKLS